MLLPAETPTETTRMDSATEQETPKWISEETLELKVSIALEQLADNEDWNVKNWKTISTITVLLKSLNQHTVRKCKYAENIWIYLIKFYKQSDWTAQMLALKRLIIWKMNPNHTIKKADQEISYIADQVHQIERKVQSLKLVEVLFLNDLPKEYENSCQLLEFHAKTLDQMIEILFIAEACMKDENKTQYEMNIATDSARMSKVKWIKKAKCYNCRETDHLSRHCKKLKKDWENNNKADENNDKISKKTENKRSDNQAKGKKKTTQQ